MSKVYAITMFALLNSRENLRKIVAGTGVESIHFNYEMNSMMQSQPHESHQPMSNTTARNEDGNGQPKNQDLVIGPEIHEH
ncbi:hypothetical protein D9758_004243 [Tetrapyrgos nigripes]|uniref:Uncharacterized protein n=1 Tax=Tetrapyrgos nigripes TaxID=182062 RepID=A0A8H5GUH5_9AGAR|nr:hypothetical protein D9758_004243 [Tetrapyrgos nigripes]